MHIKLIHMILILFLIGCNTNSMDRKTIESDKVENQIEYDAINDTSESDINQLVDMPELESKNNWTEIFKNNQIGYLTIGDSISPIINKLRSVFNVVYDSIQACEDCFDEFEYYYKILDDSNKIIFSVHQGNEGVTSDLIQYVMLFDSNYVSDKGISIGCTASDVKGKYAVSRAYFDYDNGLFFFASNFNGSFRFNCCNQEKDYSFNYEQPTVETVPDDMIVDMIVIR